MIAKHPYWAGMALSVSLLLVSCGTPGTSGTTGGSSGGGSGGSGGGVSLDGTVQEPSTVTTNISVGAGVSKSAGGSSEESEGEAGVVSVGKASSEWPAVSPRLIVSKAVTDVAASGGTCTAKKLDGTVLDTGEISASGKFSGLSFDPNALDSTKQILVDSTTANGKRITCLCDATSAVTGTIVSCGTCNADSTLSVQQIYYQGDPNCSPDNPAACAAKFTSGEIKPLALFKTFQKVYDVSSTAGTDNAANAYQAMRKAWRGAMANGTPSFSDLNSALQGGGIINSWKAFDSSLSGIDMGAAMTQIQNYIPAVHKTFSDATTYSNYYSAGDSGWEAAAAYFGKQTSTELSNGAARPEIFRGVMNQYATAYSGGNASAFSNMSDGGVARVMGQMAGKCSATDLSGKFGELQKMIDAQASSFSTLAASQMAAMGEAFCNTLKSADTAAELALINNNPSTYAGRMFANPDAFTGSAGTTAAGNMFTLGQQGFAVGGMVPCQTDAQCPSGQVCGGFNNCVSSTTCTSSCGFGSLCSSNGACNTGCCGADCGGSGSCIFPAGVSGMGAVLKGQGEACTANTDCYSNNCVSSSCSYYGYTALLANGSACTTNGQCESGNCASNLCAAVVGYPRTYNWLTEAPANGFIQCYAGANPDPQFRLIQSSATEGIMYENYGGGFVASPDAATITNSTASGGNLTLGTGGTAGVGTFSTAQLDLNYSGSGCRARYTP